MEKINKVIEHAAAKLAYNSAKHTANLSCNFCFSQSKLPEAVKKLRKF